MSDAFKELEVAGWREPGRGDAYDAVVGRVTARVAEPLLDAVGVRAGTSLLEFFASAGNGVQPASAQRDGCRGEGTILLRRPIAGRSPRAVRKLVNR